MVLLLFYMSNFATAAGLTALTTLLLVWLYNKPPLEHVYES
jgi:hypothetical protein